MLKEDHDILHIFENVISTGGELELKRVLFKKTHAIKKIRAVIYTVPFKPETPDTYEGAAKFYKMAKRFIGVKKHFYFVHDPAENQLGLLACYNATGAEVELSHIASRQWYKLQCATTALCNPVKETTEE